MNQSKNRFIPSDNADHAISVVIPTFQRSSLLLRCLLSLEQQRLSKYLFEVIVVSDGRDEATEKAVKKFAREYSDLCLRFYQLVLRSGPATARNYGWMKARHQHIVFIDDDCIALPSFLEMYHRDFSRNLSDIVYHGKLIVPTGYPATDYERSVKEMEKARFLTANCGMHVSVLQKIGGFDEDFRQAWREDTAFEFRVLAENGRIHRTDATVLHPVRKLSFGRILWLESKQQYNYLLYTKFPDLARANRINRIPRIYYLQVFVLTGILVSLPFSYNLALGFGFAFLLGWIYLSEMRIGKGPRSTVYMMDCYLTSLALPFVSLYWNFRGIIKYRHYANPGKQTA